MDEIAPSLIPSDERQMQDISADDVHESITVPVSSLDIPCWHRRGDRWQEAPALVVAQEYGMPSSDHNVEPSVIVEVSRDGVGVRRANIDNLRGPQHTLRVRLEVIDRVGSEMGDDDLSAAILVEVCQKDVART
jgi:hypothetical protein